MIASLSYNIYACYMPDLVTPRRARQVSGWHFWHWVELPKGRNIIKIIHNTSDLVVHHLLIFYRWKRLLVISLCVCVCDTYQGILVINVCSVFDEMTDHS